MAHLEVLDETAESVLGHRQSSMMATYNISRHHKQKTAALTLLQAELLRILSKPEGAGKRCSVEPCLTAGYPIGVLLLS
jgi:hypothetical protein